MYSTMDVKTNSARFPIKYLQENVGRESGSWLVLTSVDANGEKIYAIGHRRGGVVHMYISNNDLTTRGKDMKHKEDLDTEEGVMAPRKAPVVLNEVSAGQPKIDSHNDLRQHVLAIEEAFRTDSFPMRFKTTLWGLEYVDSYRLNQFFNSDTRTLKPVMHELAHKLLTNSYDSAYPAVQGGTTRTGAPATGSGMPGAPSPQRLSPRTLAKRHVAVPLSSIVGWKGAASQLACAICSTRVTSVCIECSGPDAVVPICKSTHMYNQQCVFKQCLKRHREDPAHSRRAHSRSDGKKRSRVLDLTYDY